MSKKLSKSLVLGLLVAVLGLNIQPASAVGNIQIDLPNSAVAGGETVPLPIYLTDFTYTDLTVTLLAETGTFTITDNDSVLTLNPGYSSLATQSEIGFHGAAADVITALEENTSWTAPGDPTSTSVLKLKMQVAEYKAGTSYDPVTGHTYMFVTSALSWPDAQAAAKLMTVEGKSGYLTNISSAEENTFVKNKSGAQSVWIGATMDKDLVNAALTAAGKSTISSNPQLTGDMYWGAGPEAGTHFSTGLVDASSVDGLFESWSNGEPNNWGGGEGCGVTNWNGFNGLWNDLPCTDEYYYLVEFDTAVADFETVFSSWDNLDGEDVDAYPGDAKNNDDVKTLADTGYNPFLVFAFAALLLSAGVYFNRQSRRH